MIIENELELPIAVEDARTILLDVPLSHHAFRAARRQLQDQVRKMQGHVKAHETPPHGVISSLAPGEDHGFISSADGREIYFHRNSVAGDDYDTLEVGQEVRFSEESGDEGPQATHVQPIGKHHLD